MKNGKLNCGFTCWYSMTHSAVTILWNSCLIPHTPLLPRRQQLVEENNMESDTAQSPVGCMILKCSPITIYRKQPVDTSHEWIVQRTGIHQRHIAGPEKPTPPCPSPPPAAPCKRPTWRPRPESHHPATTTGDFITPAVSSQIQHMLGCTNVPAFVLANGCTGFLYALTTAQQFISGGVYLTSSSCFDRQPLRRLDRPEHLRPVW